MPAAIRPYSIAVAPDSSFRNAVILDTGSLLVDVAISTSQKLEPLKAGSSQLKH
jgi:hypothetical protein